jgi:hypothetical protein
MKQRILFEGELGDVTLKNVCPTLISKAIEVNDDVFLRWNGATIRVEPTDTIDTLMQKYDKELRLVELADRMDMPADGRDKHLYRIQNRLAEFYIVAHSFDEAADEMKKRLDKADYGFSSYRTVPSIDHVAVQQFYNEKQSFSDRSANLIIVGD